MHGYLESGHWSFTPKALLAVAAFIISMAGPSSAQEQKANGVIAFVTYAENSRGVVRCGLFTERGWLKDPVAADVADVQAKSALCAFRNIAPGTYGLSAFHDENNNGKLDTNLIGIPTEDYCASNGARGTFGPPRFADAAFKYRGGELTLTARLK